MTSRFNFSSAGWRNPSNPWFRVGEVEVTTTVLVTAIGAISMFMWAINPATFNPLFFYTDYVANGEVWRLLTWPVVNEPNLWTVLTLVMFWYFGRDVEAMLGRNRYLGFLAALTVIPATIVFLISLIPGVQSFHTATGGLRLLEMGVFAAFVVEHLTARFFFGIQAWVLGIVFLTIDALQFIGARAWGSLWHELLTVALAIVLIRAFGFADDMRWVPRLALPGSGRKPRKGAVYGRAPSKPPSKPRAKGRRQAAVVTGPWAGSSTAGVDHQLLDRLLDKVASGGIGSLSPTERQQLDELSRRIREER